MKTNKLDKIEIQKELEKRGLFSKKSFYFKKNTNMGQVIKVLNKNLNRIDPITIRSSSRLPTLNLPRRIAKDISEGIDFISKIIDQHDIIVQEYFKVEFSIEIFMISRYNIYSEIVPGIWETDNLNPPDIIIFDKNKTTYWRYKNNRTYRFFDNNFNVAKSEISFLSKKKLNRLAMKIAEKIPSIVKFFATFSDYNGIHGICDPKLEWQFLNARNVRNIEEIPKVNDKLFHIINSKEDVKNLDQIDSEILFNVKSKREDTSIIIETAKELIKFTDTVHVECGLLSHQAIILREMGFNVKPAFPEYEYLEGDVNVDIS